MTSPPPLCRSIQAIPRRRSVVPFLIFTLLLDNYDSFTFNLAHLLHEVEPGVDAHVVRNDELTLDEAESLIPQLRAVIISPGPCSPREAGICVPLIQRFAGQIPILGICLGHQCIAEAFNLPVTRAEIPVHGKPALIHHTGAGIFRGLPSPFPAARYHSLSVPFAALDPNPDWQITAWCGDPGSQVGPVSRPVSEVMGIRRAWTNPDRAPLEGLQFHPESFLTPREHGARLLRNFLSGADAFHAARRTHIARRTPHTLTPA